MKVSVDKILTSLKDETSLRNANPILAVETLLQERAMLLTAISHRSYLEGLSLRPYMEITVIGAINGKTQLMGIFKNPMNETQVQLPLV